MKLLRAPVQSAAHGLGYGAADAPVLARSIGETLGGNSAGPLRVTARHSALPVSL